MSKINGHNILSWIKNFDLQRQVFQLLKNQYRRQDAVLHILVSLISLAAFLALIFNAHDHRFTVLPQPAKMLTAIPGLMIVWILGLSWQAKRPRLGLLITTFSQCFAFMIVVALVICAILTTPFTPIDHQLLRIDKALGFSTRALLNWLHQYPHFHSLLTLSYNSWIYQVTLLPLLLALLKQRETIDRYFMAMFICLAIGAAIYYFFPTLAPADVVKSPYFTSNQYDLITRFREIHHHLTITTFKGGVIAFPSFHVIGALLALFAIRKIKCLFFPLLLLNSLLIFSTMALGYHYLIDVIASGIIVFVVLKFISLLSKIQLIGYN